MEPYTYNHYYSRVHKHLLPVPCAFCSEKLLAKDYEKHCSQSHHIDVKVTCVWCKGATTWRRGKKSHNAGHLVKCFQAFLISIAVPVPDTTYDSPPMKSPEDRAPPSSSLLPDTCSSTPLDRLPDMVLSPPSSLGSPGPFSVRAEDVPSQTPDLPSPPRTQAPSTAQTKELSTQPPLPRMFDMTLLGETGQWCGRHPLPSLPVCAYHDSLWPLDLPPPALPFQVSALNLAISCVQQYLQRSTDWHHLLVTAEAMPRFLNRMEKAAGSLRTLPFFCWCDSGGQQHRHMVLLAPKDAWPLRAPEAGILSNQITSALQLVSLLGNLSDARATCSFFAKNSLALSRFMIRITLPRDYWLPLVLQWNNGLLQWIHQESSRWTPDKLVRLPMQQVGLRWGLQLKDVPWYRKNCFLPVSQQFRPSRTPTKHVLYLLQGQKLYWEPTLIPCTDQPSLDPLVSHHWFFPGSFHQTFLRFMRPLWMKKETLKKEKEALLQKLEESLIGRLQSAERETITLLQKINRAHEEEHKRLKRIIEMYEEEKAN